jgi:hypothetical protein
LTAAEARVLLACRHRAARTRHAPPSALREGYRLIISPIPKIIEKHSYQLASALDFLLVGNSLANAVGGYLADVRVGSWRGCEGFRRR